MRRKDRSKQKGKWSGGRLKTERNRQKMKQWRNESLKEKKKKERKWEIEEFAPSWSQAQNVNGNKSIHTPTFSSFFSTPTIGGAHTHTLTSYTNQQNEDNVLVCSCDLILEVIIIMTIISKCTSSRTIMQLFLFVDQINEWIGSAPLRKRFY